MESSEANEIHDLYYQLIDAWNTRNASKMADLFTEEGELIGFDGSQVVGCQEIYSHLNPIFEEYPTPPFVRKVKGVRFLSADVAILRAIAGMSPPGSLDLDPKLNTHQTLITKKNKGDWRIELFQNTPAQFHRRPELVKQMTEELKEVWTLNL